jgi:hypothetical protein
LHVEYPGRRVDVTRWCAAWRPVLNAPCQSYVVPGAVFCVEHEGKPSTRMAPPQERRALPMAQDSQNGHESPPDHSPTRRPGLPAAERQARSTVIAAMGNNPAAILVTIGILVETGSGPLSWSALAGIAKREGLLAPPTAPSLAGMLLGAGGRGER